MTGLALEDDSIRDFTSQISHKLGSPNHTGSFGEVHRCTINLKSGEGETEVAVKVFKIDPGKGMDKNHKGISRELNVWLRLKRPTIVPLFGIAYVDPPFPALISQWMSSGTLYVYLKKQAAITTSAKSVLIEGVADGLHYLHSENVVHGDLHPANVLIDDSGNPRLTDFGLATVVEDPELQWSTITLGLNFDPRWRAPEVLGIKDDPERPTFKSDIYSFGSVMFFIVSGNIPWKEKRQPHQICIELSTRATPARPDNIRDDHWNLIQNCWAWDPEDRPWSKKALDIITNISGLPLLEDLTGQIFGTINDHVATGAFGNVYRFEWRRPTGPVKVAVKVFKFHASEEDLRRIRREVAILARLVHENIVSLLGTTQGFGPSTALVSLWFPHGTLFRLIADKGGELSIRSKLNLLHDIASGLHYLHCFPIVHGDLTSFNILVDVKEGEYKACLTDFGLSTVLGGLLGDCTIEGSTVRYGAVRWTAPELLRLAFNHPPGAIPTKQSDIYSFGRVMFHILTLLIPWNGLDDFSVLHKILGREEIMRPEIPHATPDITDARWNEIEHCWSVDAPARPSALMIMDFLTRELEALEASTDDDVLVSEAQESSQTASFGIVDARQTTAVGPKCPIPTEVEDTTSHDETCEETLTSGTLGWGVHPQAETITASTPWFTPQDTLRPLIPQDNTSSSAITLHSSATASSLSLSRPFRFTPQDTLHPLIPQDNPSSSAITLHSSAMASSLSLSRPLNVLIFGDSGVGKSSVINLIIGQKATPPSPGAPTGVLETSYEVSLENHRFKLWEVSSIVPMGLLRSVVEKWRLQKRYRELYKDDGVHLLLYCMRNSRAQGTLVRDYKIFTSIVGSTAGRVPVAAVVTHLEDYPDDMNDWWTKNEQNLQRQGMHFSKHACITSLPDDQDTSPALRRRRRQSEQVIRSLLCDSYQAGRTHFRA